MTRSILFLFWEKQNISPIGCSSTGEFSSNVTQNTPRSPNSHSADDVTTSLASDLSKELLKIVATLIALKLPGARSPRCEPLSPGSSIQMITSPTTVEKKILAPDFENATKSTVSARNIAPRFPTLPPTNSNGPWIRLVTQGQGTLVHLGQLVGILDDHSAFLLQRVVSFNPKRVQLHILASLKPADIMVLTQPKTQQAGSRFRGLNLMSQRITTEDSLVSEQSNQAFIWSEYTPTSLYGIKPAKFRKQATPPLLGGTISYPQAWAPIPVNYDQAIASVKYPTFAVVNRRGQAKRQAFAFGVQRRIRSRPVPKTTSRSRPV
ncbi:hypothetical protein X801_06031 [Opisthorchis viverrini]|uniref:Uncharacterized protein n=1 Tax=Opisthorchis viverrini TaxID=6198 RepID=A0A1S8WUB8_OPIVI|nr:hypothetical protein X801_06031 [Opisthorchis viverrini]